MFKNVCYRGKERAASLTKFVVYELAYLSARRGDGADEELIIVLAFLYIVVLLLQNHEPMDSQHFSLESKNASVNVSGFCQPT